MESHNQRAQEGEQFVVGRKRPVLFYRVSCQSAFLNLNPRVGRFESSRSVHDRARVRSPRCRCRRAAIAWRLNAAIHAWSPIFVPATDKRRRLSRCIWQACARERPAESSSSLCGEQRGFWLTGPLGQPGTQDGDCARGERRDPLLSSLPVATHMRTGSEMDIAQHRPVSSDAEDRLDSEAEQCGVAPPGPVRPIGRGEQGVDFRSVRKVTSRRSKRFGGMARTRSMAEACSGCRAPRIETGTDGSKPRIAGAHAVLSLLLQVIEEGRPAKHQDRRYPACLGHSLSCLMRRQQ